MTLPSALSPASSHRVNWLIWPASITSAACSLMVGVGVGLGVGVGVGLSVAVGLGVGLGVAVREVGADGVGLTVLGVGDNVGVGAGVGVRLDLGTGLGVGGVGAEDTQLAPATIRNNAIVATISLFI